MRLQVLLVEDESQDLHQYQRDLPAVFEGRGLCVDLHPYDDFDQAYGSADSPCRRFDLIVSDTYVGDPRNRNAAVLKTVERYRKARRFCPLVIYSSGTKPPQLQEGPFVVWADKSKDGDIERAIGELLDTGIPHLARSLHDELDGTAGEYLWDFLEQHWDALNACCSSNRRVLERLIRRRAAVRLADLDATGDGVAPISEVDGVEYYIYPALAPSAYRLGEIIRKKRKRSEIWVILTPHCHLQRQQNEAHPRASYVLGVKAVPARGVLGKDLEKAKALAHSAKKHKKLASWAGHPSRGAVGKPEGRYWYLPEFLEIPHCYCDFQQVESISYDSLQKRYDRVAVLAPPFAESLQACFGRYYASIGLPDIRPGSIESLLESGDT